MEANLGWDSGQRSTEIDLSFQVVIVRWGGAVVDMAGWWHWVVGMGVGEGGRKYKNKNIRIFL